MTAEQACVTSETAHPKTMPSFCSTVLRVFSDSLKNSLSCIPKTDTAYCASREGKIYSKSNIHNIHNPSYVFKEKDSWKFIEKE